MFKSTDVGSTWRSIDAGLPLPGVHFLAIEPRTPNNILTSIGVFRSGDGGNSWSDMNDGLNFNGAGGIVSLTISPADPTTDQKIENTTYTS